jgi:hypothetical protein
MDMWRGYSMAAETPIEKRLVKVIELIAEAHNLLGPLNVESFKAPENKEAHHQMFYAYEKMRQSSKEIQTALEREIDYRRQ